MVVFQRFQLGSLAGSAGAIEEFGSRKNASGLPPPVLSAGTRCRATTRGREDPRPTKVVKFGENPASSAQATSPGSADAGGGPGSGEGRNGTLPYKRKATAGKLEPGGPGPRTRDTRDSTDPSERHPGWPVVVLPDRVAAQRAAAGAAQSSRTRVGMPPWHTTALGGVLGCRRQRSNVPERLGPHARP